MTEQAAVSVPDTMPELGTTRAAAVFLPVLPAPGAPITRDQVEGFENKVAEIIEFVDDVDVLNKWRAAAEALESYLRGRGLSAPMLGAQRRVEARIGQLLGGGFKPGPNGNGEIADRDLRSIESGTRHDFRILARALNGDATLTHEEWRSSRRKLVSHLRDVLGLNPKVVTPGFPDGPFRSIVIDPPWPIEKIEFQRRPTEKIDMDYQTMSLDEIRSLPIARLAHEEGCHVYLWVTHKFLPEGLRLFEHWGVRYECLLTWIKPTAQPLWWRYLTEHCLFGKVGALPPLKKGEAVSFKAPQQKHSHKPDVFFDLVRRVSPEPRLTMFDFEREGFERYGHMHS